MRRKLYLQIMLSLFFILIQISVEAKKQKSSAITDINEIKEFKNLMKSKTNVLILYVNSPKQAYSVTDVVKDTSDAVRGQATLAIIDCSTSNGKKLCKRLKIPTEKPYYIKHYKDGEFHKDYDRRASINSMTNFLRDPTGDLPWEEDPSAKDIIHLQDKKALDKMLKKSAAAFKRSLILFYAPWCGYCKTLKPEYVAAAAELKGEAILAAIDVAKSGNSKIRQMFNITGFPTLLYYEKGQLKFPYNGDNNKDSIVQFMRDPTVKLVKKKEIDESWSEDTDVVHLNSDNIDKVLSKTENAFVVFYAPWCGYCKRIKPELEKAASRVKREKINILIAAVDMTKFPDLAIRFDVKAYPTIKYFKNGVFQFDAGHAREENQIVDFGKDPQEPPPPPPPETPWAEEDTAVRHLDSSNFRKTLRKAKHAIVMFYAPWCGYCKSTKPEFVEAAENFADELLVVFGAVDCTLEKDLCANYDVKGYPTFKYLSFFDVQKSEYNGGRKASDFVSFIHSQLNAQTLQKEKKSAQDSGFGVNVRIATDDDYENIIADSKPTFVMYYAAFCGHCVTVKPAFSKLATKIKEDNGKVNIIAVDAADNGKVADLARIQILPTLKMFRNGKLVADYEGDRSYEDMLKFCQTHAQVKDEL